MSKSCPPRRNPVELEAEIRPIMRKYNLGWNAAVRLWMHKIKKTEPKWEKIE